MQLLIRLFEHRYLGIHLSNIFPYRLDNVYLLSATNALSNPILDVPDLLRQFPVLPDLRLHGLCDLPLELLDLPRAVLHLLHPEPTLPLQLLLQLREGQVRVVELQLEVEDTLRMLLGKEVVKGGLWGCRVETQNFRGEIQTA